MKYTKRNWAAWAVAAGIRAAKTFGQSAAAVLVSSAVVQDVDWALVLGSAALAALISLATSLAGLPELPDADGDGIPDEYSIISLTHRISPGCPQFYPQTEDGAVGHCRRFFVHVLWPPACE